VLVVFVCTCVISAAARRESQVEVAGHGHGGDSQGEKVFRYGPEGTELWGVRVSVTCDYCCW